MLTNSLTTLASSLASSLTSSLTTFGHPLLLAQEEAEKLYNLPWAVVVLCIVLAMMLTLRASKREEIKDKPLELKSD